MSATPRTTIVRIRELRAEDRPRWNELWAGYLTFYKTRLSPEITEFTWQRLLNPAEALHGFAALDERDQMIGFTHYHFHASSWSLTGYCYLEDLFVDPECRARGTGRALIEAVYQAADQRGASRVYWHTENTNARAQVLYHQVAELSPFVQFRRRK